MRPELLDWVGFAVTDERMLADASERHQLAPRPVEAAALELLRGAWSGAHPDDRPAIERKVRMLEHELGQPPLPLGTDQVRGVDEYSMLVA